MRFKFLLKSLFTTILFVVITIPFIATASSPDDVTITLAPQNPIPNQSTTITLTDYTDNLNTVLIVWSVNNKNVSSGIGDTSLSLNAPALGSETVINTTISFPDGNIQKTIVIRPSTTILLWQAEDSYVPPFYKGKALPSADSQIKVVAMPEIKTSSGFVNPKNIIYSWQLDNTNDQTNSGYGKQTYSYVSDYLDASDNVDVVASTIDQSLSSETNLDIATVAPKIDFYKNDPDLGTLWDQALSDGHQIIGNEIIQASPYFISPEDIRIPFLSFNWYINGEQVAVSDFSKNLLPLKTQAGTSGTSTIQLNISNSKKIVDTASKEISVNF